jgi:Fe-S-cluster containining protein
LSQSPQIHTSPEQNFACEGCGKCCYTPWKVPADSVTADTIQTLSCYQESKAAGYQALKLVGDEFQIGRRENGECVFWKDGGCEIHREAGGHSKPSVCQLFPFGLVNTPEGYFMSLSFSCPTVLANSGPPASNHRADITQVVATAAHLNNAPLAADSQYSLSTTKEIGWPEYLQLEERLKDSFDPRNPYFSLLLCVSRFLEDDPNLKPEQSATLPEAIRLLPLFVCNTIALLEYPEDAETGDSFALQLFQGGTKLYSPLLDGQELTEFLILDPRTMQELELVERYVRNFIFGKRLTTGPTIVARILMLTGQISVLFFYLDQLRVKGKQYSLKDLERAFDLLETNLAVHREDLAPAYLQYEQMLLDTI